jgi:hypothetical protein
MDSNKALEQIQTIQGNLTSGGKVILTQRENVNVYRLKCDSTSCGKVFYEFTAMQHCPHCAGAVTSDGHDEIKINCEILLNTQTGQISAGARKIADN